jgi:ammonia channel protein AmtB
MEHTNEIHKNIIGNSNLLLQLLAYRMAGATIIFIWASVASCIMFGILKCTGKLRVSAKDEQQGKILLITWHYKPTHSLLMFISTYTEVKLILK